MKTVPLQSGQAAGYYFLTNLLHPVAPGKTSVAMLGKADFDSFQRELARLVETFGKNLAAYKSPGYDEANLRQEFLDPFFDALGWDMTNKAGLIPAHREVIIERRTGAGRADYLFQPERKPRFVCEAKKPAEELPKHAQQAKGYAWTIGIRLAVLSDFEELNVYVVTGNPEKRPPDDGLIRHYHYSEYVAKARELWDLLARDNVAGGSVERLIGSLPKKLRPLRTKDFDEEFLAFLDGHRRALASDLIRHNDSEDLLEGTKLNEAVQCILDRLLFIRISEARGIDMGTKLHSLLETWKRRQEKEKPDSLREEPPAGWGGVGLGAPRGSLWNSIVRHIRALDRRPPSHVPFFNGNLFKQHFSEEMVVGDVWLSEFLEAIGEEKSSYKFGYVAVEILGTIYERFLGKIVRPHGRGAVIEEKPEVRKAGGVYYTPRYIVEYIVEQTVGKLLEGKKPEETLKLRFLDPACGSGSFLLRVFERVCEHWQQWLVDNPAKRKKDWCWFDAKTNTLHLTARIKRRILRETVHGVDLDPQAVEVTQLSLYLKMLEGETTETLQREQDLFGGDEPILPPLQDNIKCGNSLIASDFSMMPDGLVRVHAFDWPVQFAPIMKAGGFDAVVGNPPYIRIQTMQESDAESVEYLNQNYAAAKKGNYDIYVCFVERALSLVNPNGTLGFILPHKFFNAQYGEGLREVISGGKHIRQIVHFGHQQVFEGATTYTCLLFLNKSPQASFNFASVTELSAWSEKEISQERKFRCSDAKAFEWNFNSGPDAGLIERLFALPIKLSDVAHLFVGLQTDADDVFIVELVSQSSNELVCFSRATEKEHKFEREHLKLLLKGSLNVRRYELDSVTKRLIFPYETVGSSSVVISEKDYKKRFPKTWRYLEENRDRLSKRNKGKQPDGWHGYIYKKNHTRLASPKIVVPSLGTGSCFALDSTGQHYFVGSGAGGGGGYGIVPTSKEIGDIRFLLGLLNSRLLSFLIRKTSTPFRGGYIALNRQYIERLPIQLVALKKPADKTRHDKLVLLVDKMLALMSKLRAATSDSEKATLQNAVTATDQQIDALVYELYGLTAAEIKLVEGGEK
ncbi:MAG: Eco57I restriction-modification methylase domain-containing protein [Verrucomicrobia bacterium]|nr:Eco57I restriction-modification methylase domain-containing protein [Verrucomicrobiota bacterium]